MVIGHGIPLVAGSDAHRPEDVGRHFEMIADHIRKAVSP
jgi:histidinol phosphatase-like PHP family hydrolase